MTLTAHSLIAAAIVSKVTNPIIGLPLILASHFIADKIPHWDVMTNKEKTHFQIGRDTLIDIILGFVGAGAFFLLTPRLDGAYFFLGVLISQSPDLLEAPYVFPQFNNPISKVTYNFQHYVHDIWYDARLEAPWGIITQVIVVCAFLLWSTI